MRTDLKKQPCVLKKKEYPCILWGYVKSQYGVNVFVISCTFFTYYEKIEIGKIINRIHQLLGPITYAISNQFKKIILRIRNVVIFYTIFITLQLRLSSLYYLIL